MKSYEKTQKIVVFILLLSLFCTIIAIVPSVNAEGGLTIYPSSGPEGTEIEVSINIQQYYYDQYLQGRAPYYTGKEWEDYAGNQDYVIVWNFDSGEQSQPDYWHIIGNAHIDSQGNLRGTATIPTVYADTDYPVAAAYRYADQAWMDWWEGTFVVTAGGDGGGGSNNDNWPCIIATATYGGPFEPEVSFMRHVRDGLIGSNTVGQQLVKGWNSFYYSWSPPIAGVIAQSDVLKSISSGILTPLLVITHLSAIEYHSIAWISPEFASLATFVTAAMLCINIYLLLPLVMIIVLIKNRETIYRLYNLKK